MHGGAVWHLMLDTTISLGAGSISLGAGRSHVLMGGRSWYMYIMYMRGSVGVCSNLDWRTHLYGHVGAMVE